MVFGHAHRKAASIAPRTSHNAKATRYIYINGAMLNIAVPMFAG